MRWNRCFIKNMPCFSERDIKLWSCGYFFVPKRAEVFFYICLVCQRKCKIGFAFGNIWLQDVPELVLPGFVRENENWFLGFCVFSLVTRQNLLFMLWRSRMPDNVGYFEFLIIALFHSPST